MSKKFIQFNVSVPTEQGFVGRSCKSPDCNRYFKVRIESLREEMFCPYCGTSFSKEEFTTNDQKEYFTEAAVEKAKKYMYDEIDKMLGKLARQPRSKHVIFQHRPIRYREKTVRPRYKELEVDSELVCSECSFPFQVFGIFGYCPGCRSENLWIYDANFAIIRQEVASSSDPHRALRHAYSDLVSTFESFCRAKAQSITTEAAHFQVLFDTRSFFKKHLGIDIFEGLILQRKVALLRKVGHDYVILRLRRCDGRRPSRVRVRLRCER
jgi:predicted Zn-ribbon and HTH transcriptional regulator